MENCREQIAALLRVVTLRSLASYSWLGRRTPQLPWSIREKLSPFEVRQSMLYTLQAQLYQDFYCQGGVSADQTDILSRSAFGYVFTLTQELSSANCGRGFWESGWEVRSVIDNQVLLARNGLVLCLTLEGQSEFHAAAAIPGGQLDLRLPKESAHLSPGYYIAFSDQPMVEQNAMDLVRFYWNVTPPGAILLMKSVTVRLNGAGLRFRLKVLNDPGAYRRCDAGVLYIHKEDCTPVTTILEDIYSEIQRNVKPPTPVFTKKLADGLGLAEDPGQGESFGMYRCRILAEGMLRAYEQGKGAVEERLAMIESCFLEQELSLEKPFLNSKSYDQYTFRPRADCLEQLVGEPPVLFTSVAENDFLRTATQIGIDLSERALWYQESCNWLAPKVMEDVRNPVKLANAYGSLGPDLYSGTSGVALFLGELYAYTGNIQVRKTALGAIEHAMAQIDEVQAAARPSLFTGWLGIALAATRLSQILEQPELTEHARRLLQKTISAADQFNQFDILGGRAGAIVACLVLHETLNDSDALEFAVRMGDELINDAVPSAAGISWKMSSVRHTRNLTGFSHGTAGAAHALLELFSSTGDTRYREVAQKAFDYERYWFDEHVANWPDFREQAIPRGAKGMAFSFANAWCHGAPGIALSRLRAYELFGDALCRDEAIIALQTTRVAIEAELKTGTGNYSLCHGLAGNSEVLLYGAQVLVSDPEDWSTPAFQVGISGNQRYVRSGHEWPCGSSGGESPGLMTGLAGIGYFYLHLSGALSPSLLLLRREDFRKKSKFMKQPIE